MSASSLTAWQPMDGGGTASVTAAATASPILSEADTEQTLLARSRSGDLEAFGLLYQRHEQMVYRHAYRLLEDPDEADDVRQETFVRAYQSLARFRGDAAFRTYLLSICGNLCRDRHRQRMRRPEHRYGLNAPDGARHAATVVSGGASFAGDDPLLRLEREGQAEMVWRALRQLPAAQREILLLRHVEGLDLDAVALAVGCTRLSAPVRLFRARSRFKEIYLTLLQEEGD